MADPIARTAAEAPSHIGSLAVHREWPMVPVGKVRALEHGEQRTDA